MFKPEQCKKFWNFPENIYFLNERNICILTEIYGCDLLLIWGFEIIGGDLDLAYWNINNLSEIQKLIPCNF